MNNKISHLKGLQRTTQDGLGALASIKPIPGFPLLFAPKLDHQHKAPGQILVKIWALFSRELGEVHQKELEEEEAKKEDTSSAIIVEIEVEKEKETEKETEEEEEEDTATTAMIIAGVEKETMEAETMDTEIIETEEMRGLQQHTVRFGPSVDDPYQRSAMKSSTYASPGPSEVKLRKSIAPPKCVNRRSSVDYYSCSQDNNNNNNDNSDSDDGNENNSTEQIEAKKKEQLLRNKFIKPVLKKRGHKSYSLAAVTTTNDDGKLKLTSSSRSLSPLQNNHNILGAGSVFFTASGWKRDLKIPYINNLR
ncbi:hypothetical protein FRACYDRAFT_255316 [Fragilariopsis cylindrus CCMP1102]|uniref:Uncharacterized protein n=1 Tax=Fragilariopsis cylindrus CCMP1102 TaxID=635003 RepID=A0A1E7EK73_9STRA|nr:hypothetical protein FRACYDRAFT_255316 [Fragilariopsis cylindrus CCMP1102]|eukprot:OEU06286.1 hypothetical protein FRACYDRAFT_255316 [Fragilariopsis cylindrus CCMP1102]